MNSRRHADPLEIFNFGKPVHAILAWNPWKSFDDEAPKGIRLWTEVLDHLHPSHPDPHAWWGKLSIRGVLGMPLPADVWVSKFNHQIETQDEDSEMHLYMYGAFFTDRKRPTLHVAKIKRVEPQNGVIIDNDLVPRKFYQSMRDKNSDAYQAGELIPYWFKMIDIREIGTDFLENLQQLNLRTGRLESFNHVHFDSPLPVIEMEGQTFFDEKELGEKGLHHWWEEIREELLLEDPETGQPCEQVAVVRKAEVLAKSTARVLRNCREIRFIDPHFDPTQIRRRNILEKYLEAAIKGRRRRLLAVEFHLEESDKKPSKEEFERRCKKWLPKIIPQGITLRLVRWSEFPVGQELHNRYILTEKVGVIFAHGLDEARDGDRESKDDLTLMDPQLRLDRWLLFDKGQGSAFKFKDETLIKGSLTLEL